MRRPQFLRWLAAAPLAAVAAARAHAAPAPGLPPSQLPSRRLGRTGLEVPILGLGGHHVSLAGSERAARELIDCALEEGIRFFDTAESYGSGRSEEWLGTGLASVRRDVVLMTKTFDFPARTADGAKRHLDGSLARLRTDYLDLWQLHSVRSAADVDRAFAPGGAMETILAMRDARVVRFVGVTGHADPAANLRALHYWDRGFRFDVMQFPLNPVDWHQRSFQRALLPELARREIGVIAMKTTADAALLRQGICSNEECRRYAWSQPIAVAVVGMERPDLVRQNARLARAFQPLAAPERQALLDRVAPKAALNLEWYKQ